MRVRFYTLGCKVNQYETELLEELFANNGFTVAHDGEADVIIVNSCTVTATSDKKSRQLLRRVRRENPGAAVAITGCMPQALPATADILPEADIVTGAKNRAGLLKAVQRHLMTGERVVDIAPHLLGDKFEPMSVSAFRGRSRAFLKIQDGCDKRCSYCIIPTARGHIRSKAPADIKAEVAALAAAGFKEVVLVGINLALYGAELGLRLPDGAAAASGLGCRVRLSSVDPVLLSVGDLRRLSENPDICEHFHLSLQSGSDATLARMRRGYTAAQYREMAQEIRRLFKNPSITTDIIAGFPGETDDEFAETAAFVREMALADAHIFEYSVRPGTPAAEFDNQVEPYVKKMRAKILSDITAESRADFLRSQIGTTAELIPEDNSTGQLIGHSRNYTPVRLSGSPGGILTAKITSADSDFCEGEIL